MSENQQLARTGLGTVTVFGLVVNEWWLLAVAAALVLLGVVLLRVSWRRGRLPGA